MKEQYGVLKVKHNTTVHEYHFKAFIATLLWDPILLARTSRRKIMRAQMC